MASKKFKHSTSTSPTGARLALYRMEAGPNAKGTKAAKAAKGAKGVVHINHGMAEHAARYQRFANALVKAGYHVIAHDHRGHGKTTADDAPLGVFSNNNGLQKAIEDIAHVNAIAVKDYDGLPVILFGHSMGAILGFNYCLTYPQTLSAAALWNAGFDTGALAVVFKILLNSEKLFKGSDVPSGFAQKLTFEDWNKKFAPNRTQFDWLSRDEKEVDKYVADPLCGFPVSVGMWLDVLKAIQYGAGDKNLANLPKSLPFHLQAGATDPCSTRGAAVARLSARLENAGISNVDLNILPDTRHESLNEINRDEITADFIGWLDGHFG